MVGRSGKCGLASCACARHDIIKIGDILQAVPHHSYLVALEAFFSLQTIFSSPILVFVGNILIIPSHETVLVFLLNLPLLPPQSYCSYLINNDVDVNAQAHSGAHLISLLAARSIITNLFVYNIIVYILTV